MVNVPKGLYDDAFAALSTTIYAAIATSSSSGAPWNSPLYVVYDNQLNFYWASDKTSQHSRNIQANPRVFLAIYDSNVAWGAGRGLFIQAEASEVDDPDEIVKACQLRQARSAGAEQHPEDFTGQSPRRIYRATPKQAWINVDSTVDGFFVDERVELDLATIGKFLGT